VSSEGLLRFFPHLIMTGSNFVERRIMYGLTLAVNAVESFVKGFSFPRFDLF
jgi:hypothetical protein